MQQRTFDPLQQEAIEIHGGRHLVLAPPGCGKTDILTERVVHAHAHGIDYGNMLCLTFTNRAAKGMAQRIADRTANPVPDRLFVGNIHRFCSQMLFSEGLVNHNSAIIDEADVENIIQEELCRKLNIKSRTTELMRYQHALWQLSLGMRGEVVLHNELLHIGPMHKLCDVLGMMATEENIANIYTNIETLFKRYPILNELPAAHTMRLALAYQQYKANNDLLDYDDLLVLAYQHLLQTGKPGSYSWIEVDEVQDLNPLQFALIDHFATNDATIVYLGDEQQAIFSFIGAKQETIEQLKQRCHGNIHYLQTNYRSPQYLLNLQNDYAANNLGIPRNLLPTSNNTSSHAPSDLCLLNVGDAQLESYYAARFAQRYGEIDTSGRVAILVSTNREADDISQTMTSLHTPHFKISGTDLFSIEPMRMLIAHINILSDETVFIAWARLFWGLGITPSYTAARNLMRDMRRVALLPSDILLYPSSSYIQTFTKAYNDSDIIIFDTETTGLDPYTDDIIQIAAIRIRRGKVIGQSFNIILETDKEIPPTVGGNPNPMLEVYNNSRRLHRAEGLRKFIAYCKGAILVGHNVDYDYRILDANLHHHCPDLQLKDICPTALDTLKYIRLVRPRLRHYKLGHLLEALHLEGTNSHQADDDILATLSLLRFCHTCALTLIPEQRQFIANHQKQFDKFATLYADIYRHGLQSIADTPLDASTRPTDSTPALLSELQYTYNTLLSRNLIAPIDKWQHFSHYLQTDLIRTDLYPTLRQQLERYTTDLNTAKEADLCGHSLQERFIISTVHKAKGLEFETVIIYRAIDGEYPAQRSWTEKQIQEDARRLFVALSRSRQRLCILYDDHLGTSSHTLSPFLQKVKKHFTHYQRLSNGKIALL